MTTLKCSVCGKEFEAKDDDRLTQWMLKNPDKVRCSDCYGKSAKKSYAKKDDAAAPAKKSYTGSGAAASKGSEITADVLRKSYDEIVASFADVIDEVRPFLGAWATTIALSKSKAK